MKRIFTWWDGATIGTQLFTARSGRRVGTDDAGNVYYRAKQGSRRWVIYNGPADSSRIPAEWHGWMHGSVDEPPSEHPPLVRAWEQPHRSNATGTPAAYRPSGALDALGVRAPATGDYEAWRPE